MTRQSIARSRVVAATWTVLCFVVMLVGFATPDVGIEQRDPLSAVPNPALTDGDVALIALVIWLLGLLLLSLAIGLRRLLRRSS